MRHPSSKTDWFQELNEELAKLGAEQLEFELQFVLVEEDWACGREPEDVAGRIQEGGHPYVQTTV